MTGGFGRQPIRRIPSAHGRCPVLRRDREVHLANGCGRARRPVGDRVPRRAGGPDPGASTGNSSSSAYLLVGSGLAVACLVVAGLMRRPFGVTLGWLIQVATFLCAFVLPMMLIVGVIFTALWVVCLVAGPADRRDPGRPGGRSGPLGLVACDDDASAPSSSSSPTASPADSPGRCCAGSRPRGTRLVALDAHAGPRAAGPALRRARGQAVLRAAGRVHVVRPGRRRGHRGAARASRASGRSPAPPTRPSPLPGTIRGDLGRDWGPKVQQNIVHGSDSPESAPREIGIWFPEL